MLHAVKVSDNDDHGYDVDFTSSMGLAMQMFRRAMSDVASPYDYHFRPRRESAQDPEITRHVVDVPIDGEPLYHDRGTQRVTIEGPVFVHGQTKNIYSVSTMIWTQRPGKKNRYWEPIEVVLTMNGSSRHFTFEKLLTKHGYRYLIRKTKGDDGPQPAKV